MEIGKWKCDLEQEPEQCSYLTFSDDRRCIVCGIPEGIGIQHHSGPEMVATGWFESPEYRQADAWVDVESDLRTRIEKRGDIVLMPLHVVACISSDDGATWTYSFRGVKMVERVFAEKLASKGGRCE